MECDCLPPPPVFDVPPPIDPSAIWDLLSDEPRSALDKLHAQSCDYNPLLHLVTGPPSGFAYLALALAAVLLLAVSVLGVVLRCRRRAPAPKKKSLQADSVLRAPTDWSYNSMKLPNAVSAIQMYAGNTASPSLPGRPAFPALPPNARFPSAASATLRICQDGCYSSASRHYEEIPAAFQVDDSETLFEDVSCSSDGAYYVDGNPCRRPPPSCRPPPPPLGNATSPVSSLSFDQSGSNSTIDRELAKIQGSPSPRRSDDGAQGRESGYGTGPSRLWHHSPRLKHKKFRETDRSVPLTVFAQQPPQHSSMTYV
uniref:Ephrin RBD domain-containing protein n=1 Tax=Steinernema glaseri TaxID=37863 RepID=A0A1I7Y5X9_9BILA